MSSFSGLRSLSFTFFLACVASSPATAAAKELGKFGDWEAYADTTSTPKTCHMVSAPQSSKGAPSSRKQAYLMISHRGSEKNVVRVHAGIALKKDSTASFVFSGPAVLLFTKGSDAWAWDDAALVKTMIKANTGTISFTPATGKGFSDTYSMAGFTAANEAISEACGVK